ncbi:hypothetical protein [Cellulosimicrobium marinum]|uniref:hypothetical protein n=1 Tax=Cellulosimicrobium marinum TaxID=1638992 RepID=UPI001E47BAA0|nr:hypothetical protein [Cellulosimicrobium marinum]MCB7138205.1 hypothetical protein [Cellulosimicrobium marinum]
MKSDLVFGHEDVILDVVEEVVGAAPTDAPVREVLVGGLRVLAERWPTSREHAAVRAQVVAGSAELQERDLAKRARVRDHVVASLRSARPTADPLEVALWADVGLAAFRLAHDEWVAGRGTLPQALTTVLRLLDAQPSTG